MPSRALSPISILINGAPDPTLRALTISRSTGGGQRDHAVYEVDLGATKSHIQNLALTGPAGAEVRFEATINGAPVLLHWGKATISSIEIGDGEHLRVTSSVEPYHFGVPLTGALYWDPLTQQTINILEEPVWNPEIDDAVFPNATTIARLGGFSSVFLDPESTRTDAALAVQGDSPQLWTLAGCVNYLCWALNGDQLSIANPTDFSLFPNWTLNNFRLQRGRYLSEYLDEILPRFGLGWFLDLSSGQPTIAFFVRGQGTPNSVYLGPPGSGYNLDNAVESHADWNFGNVRNQVICQGDYRRVESTFVLSRGWDVGLDAVAELNLSKDSDDYGANEAYRSVWRNWVLNEAGDYIGRRPEIVAPYNLGLIFGHATPPRRRKFLPTLTLDADGAPIGETAGITVEYSIDAGTTWLPIDRLEDRTCVILERECGVRFDGLFPPPELVRAGDKAQVRVTATVRDDLRLGTVVGPDASSPLADTAAVVLDESAKFHWRTVLATSKYWPQVHGVNPSQPLEADEADDTLDLEAYAAWLQDTFDLADVGGSLVVEGFDNGVYTLGDLITAINGRAIVFNAQSTASGQQRYPQVVGIAWDHQAQRRTLTIETYRDPQSNWLAQGGRAPGGNDKRSLAERDHVRKRSGLGEHGAKTIRRYQLTADLTAGGSADAKFVEWDSTNSQYATTAQTFTVYSLQGATGSSGDRGYCAYNSDRRQWEALAGGGGTQVQWITFYLPQALSGQLSVANCPVITDWYNNAGATAITVFNELGFTGDAGAEGYAAKVPATGRWVIIQLPCAAGTS